MKCINNMKNVIIVLVGALITTSLSAQDGTFDERLDPTLQRQFDSINVILNGIEAEFPTWKTGDDNSGLVGLFSNIIYDSIAKHLFSLDPSVSQLHVTGFNTIHKRVTLNTWLTTLDPDLYPTDKFNVKHGGDGEIEHLYVFKNDGKMVREIMIIWDKTQDGSGFTNLRTIMDSYFNE